MKHKKTNRSWLPTVYVVLFFFLVGLIYSAVTGKTLFTFLNLAQTNQSQQQGEIRDFINNEGFIELKPTGNVSSIPAGSQASLDVLISLPEKQVVGFNIPIKYDAARVDFAGVESNDARFNIYARREGTNHVVLVANLQPSTTDKVTLYKKVIARVLFKVKTKGVSQLDIVAKSPSGYKIKLVTGNNETTNPSFGSVRITGR